MRSGRLATRVNEEVAMLVVVKDLLPKGDVAVNVGVDMSILVLLLLLLLLLLHWCCREI
jgi:hypothetical protein